jgi:hypothetical protein
METRVTSFFFFTTFLILGTDSRFHDNNIETQSSLCMYLKTFISRQ